MSTSFASIVAISLKMIGKVLEDKVRYLCGLLACSQHTLVLTGAGASTSAGLSATLEALSVIGPQPTFYFNFQSRFVFHLQRKRLLRKLVNYITVFSL